MFCSKCGTESSDSAGAFCIKCGAKLAVDESPRVDDQIDTLQEPEPSFQRVPTIPLPGGYILSGGEEIVRNEEYVFSLSHFWLKSHVVLTNKSMLWEKPNVKVGFLPMGRQTGNVPLAQIAGVSTNRQFSILKFLVGVLFLISGLGQLANGALGLILFIIGIIILAAVLQTTLIINHLGGPTALRASVRQRVQLEKLSTELSQTIANLRR